VPDYFAYGSNMDPAQMQERIGRVPHARVACLKDYQLRFNKRSKDGTGKANIVMEQGSAVWGVVFACEEAEMHPLDRAEGAPKHYRRTAIEVECDDGVRCAAIAYVAQPGFLKKGLQPAAKYRARILNGARYFNLPGDYVRSLENA